VTRFGWDPRKAEANRRKHGVTFQEAETVADRRPTIDLDDRDPADLRLRLTGYSSEGRLLVVIASLDDRIISARRATKREADDFHRRRA
jgi:uncharacterized protein